MSRFMLLARAAPEPASDAPQTGAPRNVAANDVHALPTAAHAHAAGSASPHDPPERTALWFWAEPSRPDAP